MGLCTGKAQIIAVPFVCNQRFTAMHLSAFYLKGNLVPVPFPSCPLKLQVVGDLFLLNLVIGSKVVLSWCIHLLLHARVK